MTGTIVIEAATATLPVPLLSACARVGLEVVVLAPGMALGKSARSEIKSGLSALLALEAAVLLRDSRRAVSPTEVLDSCDIRLVLGRATRLDIPVRLGTLFMDDPGDPACASAMAAAAASLGMQPEAELYIYLAAPNAPARAVGRVGVRGGSNWSVTARRLWQRAGEDLARVLTRLLAGEDPASGASRVAPLDPVPVRAAHYASAAAGRALARIARLRPAPPPRWEVRFALGEIGALPAPTGHEARLAAPDDCFVADPFMCCRDGRDYCFVEEFPDAAPHARIAVYELFADGTSTRLGTALDTDFHLSYPHLFDWEGTLYMLPEAQASGRIPLYRCTDFPLGWTHVHDITLGGHEGTAPVDSTLFPAAGRWWLATGLDRAGIGDWCGDLSLFEAPTPLAERWEPHVRNPQDTSTLSARPGGQVLMEDGRQFRVGQSQMATLYGAGFSLREITRLDAADFAETPILTFETPRAHSGHHLNATARGYVYDMRPLRDVR
jgi:hypothetical protein